MLLGVCPVIEAITCGATPLFIRMLIKVFLAVCDVTVSLRGFISGSPLLLIIVTFLFSSAI